MNIRSSIFGSSSFRVILLLGSVLLVGILGSFALSIHFDEVDNWLPIGVSFSSLAIAILASFKSELFDFSLEIIGGDFALIHGSNPDARNSAILFPLHFLNRGYGEGVVLSLYVEAKHEQRGETYLLIPVADVDMKKLIQNTGKFKGDQMNAPFMSFPLGPKEVEFKSLIFTWESTNSTYSKPYLGPGTYQFKFFVETSKSKNPIELFKFEHEFDQKTIDDFAGGNSIYNLRPGAWVGKAQTDGS